MKKFGVFLIITLLSTVLFLGKAVTQPKPEPPLWQVYQQSLKTAKYVDLTHTITPAIPVWAGFGASTFAPTLNPNTGKPYNYKEKRMASRPRNTNYLPIS